MWHSAMLGLALITSGCARQSLAPTVPARAPDSIASALWDSLTAPANLITDAPHLHGTWARNVMIISFKRTATQADRQAAIALINGEVVGGRAMPLGEPQYIVRIPYALPGDSLSGPVLRAFKTLMDHPAIVAVYPLGMDNFDVLHDRGAPSTLDLRPSGVTLVPPVVFPKALFDSVGTVTDPSPSGGTFRKDIVTIDVRHR